jgi:hypothetical protein
MENVKEEWRRKTKLSHEQSVAAAAALKPGRIGPFGLVKPWFYNGIVHKA